MLGSVGPIPRRQSVPDGRLTRLLDLIAAFTGADDLAPRLRRAILAHPRVLELRPETVIKNLGALSAALSLSRAVTVQFCISAPALFYADTSRIADNARRLSALLDMPLPGLLAKLRHAPTVLGISMDACEERLEATGRVLGLDRAGYLRLCSRNVRLLILNPDDLSTRISDIAGALQIEETQARSAVLRSPQLLFHAAEHLRDKRDALSVAFDWDPVTAVQVAMRYPRLLSQKAETLRANLQHLADELDIPFEAAAKAARKMPPLLYLAPSKVAEKIRTVARLTRTPMATLTTAFLRMPTLAGRDPRLLARRIRLTKRIAAATGQPCSAEAVLMACPAVCTYGANRLLLRWLAVKLGLWTHGWAKLVVLPDRRIDAMFQNYLDGLPEGDHAAERLRLLLDKRLRRGDG